MDIFQFITQKSKQAGLKRIDLANKINVSKTTMHRYMHGEFIIYPEKEADIAKALKLTKEERKQFHEIITQTIPKRPMQKAYQAMDTLVFGSDEQMQALTDRDVLFLSADRNVISTSKMFERILLHATEKDFECSVRIIHGISEDYVPRLVGLLEELFKIVPSATVEHLISTSSKDYAKAINILTTTLPLLKYSNYSLYYSKNDLPDDFKCVFKRSFYISTSFKNNGERKHENFLISFPEHSIPICLISSDPMLHEMLTNEYLDVRKDFENSLCEFRNIGVGEEFLIELEQNYDIALIKPNQCYSNIPVEVYRSLIDRCDTETKKKCAAGIVGTVVPDEAVDSIIDSMIASIRVRVDASFARTQTVSCSKSGLLEFSQTGRLTDHLNWLPSFDKNEIKICLEYLRDRNKDEHDSFRLYVTREDILKNGYILCVCKDDGLFIEYNQEAYRISPNKNLYIKNKIIADVVYDYAESHIPSSHSLTREETTNYINELIETHL